MLKFEEVSAAYSKTPILERVSFQLVPHKFTAVIGKNGCGKSTLVSCINQELRYTGEISFGDRSVALMPIRERARVIAILPQFLASPAVTVEELVAFGRSPYLDIGKRLSRADKEAIENAIQDVGLQALRYQRVDRLSGGERQKAYLAMILAQNTRVIVLDEPTTYMDAEYEAAFLNKLTELKTRHKKTLMVIMHNLTQAVNFADNVVVLHEKRVAFEGSTAQCLESGVLEQVFRVKKHVLMEEGKPLVFFTAK